MLLFEEAVLQSPGRRCVESGRYRYVLSDVTRGSLRDTNLLWCMLNPSTADGGRNDPTTRRVAGFTSRHGFERWTIVNCYAFRATAPSMLDRARRKGTFDVVGPLNEQHMAAEAASATAIVAAWGAHHVEPHVLRATLQTLRSTHVQLLCLGTTKAGHPVHPLFVPGDQPLVPWG